MRFEKSGWARTVALVAVMTIAPAAAGCGGAPTTDGSEPETGAAALTPKATRYEAESLVRGVFFGQGEVGQRLYGERAPKLDARQGAAIDQVVRELRGDGAAMASFADDVQSGDVVRVAGAVNALDARIREHVDASAKVTPDMRGVIFDVDCVYVLLASPCPYIIIMAGEARAIAHPGDGGLHSDDWAVELADALYAG